MLSRNFKPVRYFQFQAETNHYECFVVWMEKRVWAEYIMEIWLVNQICVPIGGNVTLQLEIKIITNWIVKIDDWVIEENQLDKWNGCLNKLEMRTVN